MKRIISVFLVLAMLMSVTAAFAEPNTEISGTIRMIGPGALSDAGPDGAVSLTTGKQMPGYNALIAAFNEDYPNIKIEFTPTPWSDVFTVLQTAVAGGTADILMHGAKFTSINTDLTPFIENDPEILAAMTTGPEYYVDPEDCSRKIPTGLSYVVDPYFALVDTQLLKEWGVEVPTYDWTWEDLLEIASKTTGINPVTGEQNYGVWPFGFSSGNVWKVFSSYCAAHGIQNFEYGSSNLYEATIDFATEDAISALSYLNDLSKFAPVNYIENAGNSNCMRANNDIAIFLGEGMLNAYNSTLVDGVQDRFVFLPLPVNEDQSEAKYSSFTGTHSIAIAQNCKNPELAWVFIHWLITDEYAQQWLVDNERCTSTYVGLEKLKEQNYTFFDAYDAVMSNFWDNYSITQGTAFDSTYGNMSTIFFANLTKMYNGEITPEQCGQQITAEIREFQELNK